MMRTKLSILLCLLLLMPAAYGATISGNVYDISLNKAINARVVIDTAPKQTLISKNGTYAFEVPKGNYTLRAERYIGKALESFAEENVLVKDEGRYVIDLILFPNFAEEDELVQDTEELDISTGIEENGSAVWFFAGIGLILIALGSLYYFRKGKKRAKVTKEEEKAEEPEEEKIDDLTEKVLNVIKEEGGRTTQKGIRKKIPFSEAKISLIIAELEHKGIIEKIKKGRGNIVILKK